MAAFVKSERWWFGLTPGSIRGVFLHMLLFTISLFE